MSSSTNSIAIPPVNAAVSLPVERTKRWARLPVLTVFEHMTKLQLLRHFAAIAHGRQVQEPRISTYQEERFRITTTSRPSMPVQADGQVVGATPVLIKVVPRALTVIASPLTPAHRADEAP